MEVNLQLLARQAPNKLGSRTAIRERQFLAKVLISSGCPKPKTSLQILIKKIKLLSQFYSPRKGTLMMKVLMKQITSIRGSTGSSLKLSIIGSLANLIPQWSLDHMVEVKRLKKFCLIIKTCCNYILIKQPAFAPN